MPTTTSPPILIWQPEGGIPGGSPISNPPVYSQADVTPLILGQAYVDVVFGSVQTNDDWVLVACEVYNLIDLTPLNIWPGIITDRTTAGFRLQLNGMPDSNNYYLSWAVSGVNIAPTGATLYQLSGPTSGGLGGLTYAVRLPPSTTVLSPVTITPSDGGAGGSFNVDSVVLSNSSASATFTYFPTTNGARTISTTNSSTLVDPAGIVLTVTLPTYTLTGPSGGVNGVASTNFTVTLIGSFGGTLTVTPSDGGGGGAFTPTTVGLTTGVPSATFTYTPASTGAKTISVTNSGGLANPGSLTYTVIPVNHLLNTLISYWKLDETSGTRADSQGTNHLTLGTGDVAVAGIINNGDSFIAASSSHRSCASNPSLQVTGDFTFSVWVKFGTPILDDTGILTKSNEYILSYDPANGIYYYSGTVAVASDVAESHFTPAVGAWTHVIFWHDSGTGQAYIRCNDSSTQQSTTAPALISTAFNFAFGAQWSTIVSNFANVTVDEVGFWKRKLTSAEMTMLYNSGAGFPFSSFQP